MKKLVFCIALCAICVPLQAQHYLEGTVFDKSTMELVAGATVSIPGLGLTTQTDSSGYYAFWGSAPEFPWEKGPGIIPSGNYMVTCVANGYQAEAGYVEFKPDMEGVMLSWALDKDDDWMAEAHAISLGSGGTTVYEEFSENSRMKVYLSVPPGTVPDNSKFYIAEIPAPFQCSTKVMYTLNPPIKYKESNFRMLIQDEFGNNLHYFQKKIAVGLGNSNSYLPYIPPCLPYLNVELSYFDYQSGTWIQYPADNVYPGVYGLDFLMLTYHLSDWKSSSTTGTSPSGVSIHGSDGSWWWLQVTPKTEDAWGACLYSVQVVNGYIIGSIDDTFSSEVSSSFINTESLSSQIKASTGGEASYDVGIQEASAWANFSSNVEVNKSAGSQLTVKSKALRTVKIDQGDTNDPSLNGEIQIREKGYDLWFLIELFKNHEPWDSWETAPPTFIMTGIGIRFVPDNQ